MWRTVSPLACPPPGQHQFDVTVVCRNGRLCAISQAESRPVCSVPARNILVAEQTFERVGVEGGVGQDGVVFAEVDVEPGDFN
jgi:hypothetical protein